MIEIPVPFADLLDRITILEIKKRFLNGPGLANVTRELDLLDNRLRCSGLDVSPALRDCLAAINAQLWAVENQLRLLEQHQRFDAQFISLARSVYQLNDRRAAIKREINLSSGSPLIEEKSYG